MTDAWWDEVRLETGETRFWQIGPLCLWATRLEEEWQLATETIGEGLATEMVAAAAPVSPPGPGAAMARFGFRDAPSSLRLLPAPADRPVVVKAASPFFVPAGEEVSLFVSSALWLQVRVGGSTDLLHETPLFRPSDTWFGPSTLEGELCYAAKTAARFNLERIPRRPHRAATVVRIRNRADTQLGLERLKIPLPLLSLYGTEDGQLWTESVTLERDEEGENATVKLGKGAPRSAGVAKRLAGPRARAEKGLLTRAFGGLLRRKED